MLSNAGGGILMELISIMVVYGSNIISIRRVGGGGSNFQKIMLCNFELPPITSSTC